MTRIIEVVSHRNEWSSMFEAEAKLIKQALGDNCITVHHIGSTAVPGLAAKPIIDILPVVKNIVQVDQSNAAMEKLGYVAKGEFGMLFRRYFQKGGDNRTYNVHVYEEGNPEIERYLKFRDWMIAHSDDRDAYGDLKKELALKFPHDILSYVMGKDEFVASIDAKTGFDGIRVVQALTDREWQAVRQLRQKYFFDKVPISDPYTWTFKHADHVHFVLYKGSKIIGYAHIQLWPDKGSALRIIVIDEIYRNSGIGSDFLKICERWLKEQGVKILRIQSSPEAYRFYCKHAYIHMPFNDPDGYEGDPRDIEIGKNL
ncbi:MAG: GNAT family N-acetyltransferase [Gammaproteobacteria bacterium RIFCSPHIGHO2_12_FULL_45_12]|nr:MAG: GNAT family N-acetyltransferase [Gammaproteobacteria bacterium RIFCSPHIGHO2_12_FULL_45_12]